MKLDISNIAFKSILPNKTMEVLCVGDMYDLLKELLGIRKWLLYRNEKVIEIKYHYEIKKGDVSKSENGIGIIPHIYEDSRGYWQEREERDRGIVAAIEEQIRQAQSQNIIEVKMKRKKRHIKTAAEMLAEVDMEDNE